MKLSRFYFNSNIKDNICKSCKLNELNNKVKKLRKQASEKIEESLYNNKDILLLFINIS